MISVKVLSNKVPLPDADYVFEKVDKLDELILTLTPKFNGQWLILLVDPPIKFVKEFVSREVFPEWINVEIHMGQKKVDTVCLEFPKLQPKKVSNKDAFEIAIKNTKNLISKKAAKLLFQALGSNSEELDKTLKKLDEECTTGEISYTQVQTELHFVKIIYASDVINSFLHGESQCWDLYHKLVHNIGMEYAYNSMYAYVKRLLSDKQKYLQNEEVKNWRVKKIDAPAICYAYFLFVNSTNYNQLPAIMYRLQNRCPETVQEVIDVSCI